jgi:hypothetical protein
MRVNFPDSGHTAGYQAGGIEIVTKLKDSATYYGNAEIVNDVLMFGLMKVRGEKTDCRINLFGADNQLMADSDWILWTYSLEPMTQYVEFSEFPKLADGTDMTNCAYSIRVFDGTEPTDDDTGRWDKVEGSEIIVNVYRG